MKKQYFFKKLTRFQLQCLIDSINAIITQRTLI